MIYPSGLVTDYDYNTINQLTDVLTRDGLGTLIEHFNYQLTPTGRREVIAELSGRTTAYCYDNLYRLSDEVVFDSLASPLASGCVSDTTGASYIAHYEYDWVGNRSSETVDGVSTNYTYDDNDRLTQVGGTRYVYDDNGNTETETLDGVVKTYTWDGKNKLVQQDAAGVVSSYTYNHNGVRNSKTENGVTIAFIVDENRDYAQVLEDVVNDVATAQYTYGHDLIRQERSGVNSYYHYDGLGSTRALSDASGSLTDTYDYEAFGEVLNQTGSTENNYLFTGEQFDNSLNQYYLRARYYNQASGRFTSMDTWMGRDNDPVTLHKYMYAANDPVSYVDPTGNFFSLGGFSVANKISTTLAATNIVFTGVELFQVSTDEDGLTSAEAGALILASLSPRALKLIKVKGFKKRKSSGKKNKRCVTKNSFSEGTLVQGLLGKTPIENIEIGDLVLAYNENSGNLEYKEVTHLIRGKKDQYLRITFETGSVVNTTLDHPFNVDGEWVNAEDLSLTDKVNTSNQQISIAHIQLVNAEIETFNLSVAELHNYHVGNENILVHNCSPEYGGGALPGSLPAGIEGLIQGFVNLTGVTVSLVGSQAYTGGFATGSDWDYHVEGVANRSFRKKMKHLLPKGPRGKGDGSGQDVFSTGGGDAPLDRRRPYIRFTPN